MDFKAREELAAEYYGRTLGDPRRCPRHPNTVTSSNDGMFDGLCPHCESEMDEQEGQS